MPASEKTFVAVADSHNHSRTLQSAEAVGRSSFSRDCDLGASGPFLTCTLVFSKLLHLKRHSLSFHLGFLCLSRNLTIRATRYFEHSCLQRPQHDEQSKNTRS